MKLGYRSEIDGLRALAVIPVILFHAGFGVFSGGYVGVDVFFVISGYLITSILLGDLEKSSFSILDFYERRARRILPALFFMMAATSVAAWILLVPIGLENFSKGIISVALFVSNILFWRSSGYFDPSAELNPLLHTWSLSVEEQFYIFFPPLLWLIWAYFRRYLVPILMVGVICSLLIAQWASSHEPTANFFLLPTRAWELGIGALCALSLKNRASMESKASGPLAFTGITLILASIFLFDEGTPIPGLYGLVPTVGAAMIILFASPQNLVGRALSFRWLVSIGLVSYSAYLWHHPLFAFARLFGDVHLPAGTGTGLIALTFILAWLSWRYIERPFRSSRGFSRAQIFGFSAAGMTALIGIGIVGLLTSGGAFRYSAPDQKFLAQADYRISMQDFSFRKCFIDFDQDAHDLHRNGCFPKGDGRPRLVIFGDSEAAHLSFGADRIFIPAGYQIVQWTATSCRPIIFSGATDRCKRFVRSFDEQVLPQLSERDRIIIAGNWGSTEDDIGEVKFRSQLAAGLLRLAGSPARVVVFGNAPDFEIQPIPTIFRQTDRNAGQQFYAERIAYPKADAIVEAEVKRRGFAVFDPAPLFCAEKCLIYDGRNPVFVDSNHFSKTGSMMAMRALLEQPLLQ